MPDVNQKSLLLRNRYLPLDEDMNVVRIKYYNSSGKMYLIKLYKIPETILKTAIRFYNHDTLLFYTQ